ncbi:uncharacterized protein LOC111384401 [Olea europaea var. sylvestris]|uniref:uncharacterized protein LOC111384401 n=1 Tax=Olea europaea var. sylvestris TaxID=158386 RepID=UPI000C1CEB6B|nr:uncharacterized protein LOC111384401 [Olea europaea var. sylvestris]
MVKSLHMTLDNLKNTKRIILHMTWNSSQLCLQLRYRVICMESSANVVADTLSRKSTSSVVSMIIKNDIQDGKTSDFHILAYGILRFRARLYVPDVENIRRGILSEAHMTPYSVHPGATKMYRDLKLQYWWLNMKDEIAEYVGQCSTYQ